MYKNLTCFQIYFNDIYLYVKRAFTLAHDNNYLLTFTTVIYTGALKTLREIWETRYFGVDNVLILIVLATVFVDAYYGVKKSIKRSKEAFIEAQKYRKGSPEYKKLIKESELRRFQPVKLQFTFFKCFTLIGYLFFARSLLTTGENKTFETFLEFSLEIAVKVPLMIFWYYDFKSIGRNTTYLSPKGKKAAIFIIVENIFEPKINKLLKHMGRDESLEPDEEDK
jgi:hypothetical protein